MAIQAICVPDERWERTKNTQRLHQALRVPQRLSRVPSGRSRARSTRATAMRVVDVRGPRAALCRDLAPLAPALLDADRRCRRWGSTTVLPAVGVLPRLLRSRVPGTPLHGDADRDRRCRITVASKRWSRFVAPVPAYEGESHMRSSVQRTIAIAAFASLALVACGDDGDDAAESTAVDSAVDATSPPETTAAATMAPETTTRRRWHPRPRRWHPRPRRWRTNRERSSKWRQVPALQHPGGSRRGSWSGRDVVGRGPVHGVRPDR